jgi:SET domain-containing protein
MRRSKGKAAMRRGPRFVRRRSSIHGFGIFAVRTIAAGTRLIEYKGELIDTARAEGRYSEDETPPHTFLFDALDDLYIDAGVNGNSSRFINHSCDPNCETVQEGRRVFIESIRAIHPGEELSYDYLIMLDGPHDREAKKKWICLCGAKNCRGTMLAPKR